MCRYRLKKKDNIRMDFKGIRWNSWTGLIWLWIWASGGFI
jgi:hypothetical protein